MNRSKETSSTTFSSSNMDGDVNPAHITGLPLTLTMVALCAGIFCVALDITIIATAIPRITDDFLALQDIGWYG